MKILMVLPRFNRRKWDFLTGQAWNLAQRMTAEGWAQAVIAAGREESEPALEVVNNVPVYRFAPAAGSWRNFFQRRSDLDRGEADLPGLEIFLRKKEFDLVHIFAPGRLCQKVCRIAGERGIRRVIFCRSEYFRNRDEFLQRDSESDAGNAFHSYGNALKSAERILCGDHNLRRMLAARLGDRQLVHWQAGVDGSFFSKTSAVNFRKFYQLPEKRKLILSVGTVCESKNYELLLDTALMLRQRANNFHLVIIGWTAQERYCNKLKRRIRELNLENTVTLIPGLPPGDECFRAAFRTASLVLLPSRYDVSAGAVLEAWAAGVPVIASPAGSGGELLEDNINGRVLKLSEIQQWVAACEEILNEKNRPQMEKMRIAGLEKVRSLNWTTRLEKLRTVYEEVIAERV
ncbi:MAG: glycosyltransferase family 4 protein [Lentisphaeria bacterium]|nr:glycosyltransferase family 4 protein [Lentisphaeria bacterium]